MDAWIAATVTEFGRLDGAANLAGILGSAGQKAITETTDGDWAGTVGVNLTGVFVCLRAELRVMSEGGSVVDAASIAGVLGMPKSASYVASKVCACSILTGRG